MLVLPIFQQQLMLNTQMIVAMEMQMDHQNKVWDKKLGTSVWKQLEQWEQIA